MSEIPEVRAWQLEVTQQLAMLLQKTIGIEEQVTRQNGNVARLQERVTTLAQQTMMIGEHTTRLTKDVGDMSSRLTVVEGHPMTCPLHEKVSLISLEMAENRAKSVEDEKWLKRLSPFFWLFFMFLIGLVLGHSDMMRGFLKF